MPIINPIPSSNELLRSFRYDREAGTLTWLDDHRKSKTWRTRFVGTVAGADACNSDGTRKCRSVTLHYKSYKIHRLVWRLENEGDVPALIDHIDGDPFNNRIQNLRPATHSQNMRNRGVQRNNISGIKGVTFAKARAHLEKPWVAKININGRSTNLGAYATKGLAAVAHAKAAMRFHGAFAYVR